MYIKNSNVTPEAEQKHSQGNEMCQRMYNIDKWISTTTLVGHFVVSHRKGEEREAIVEEMKERDREEGGK